MRPQRIIRILYLSNVRGMINVGFYIEPLYKGSGKTSTDKYSDENNSCCCAYYQIPKKDREKEGVE